MYFRSRTPARRKNHRFADEKTQEKRERTTNGPPFLFCFLCKKVIHRTTEHVGKGGEEGNVWITFLAFPFGNSLWR